MSFYWPMREEKKAERDDDEEEEEEEGNGEDDELNENLSVCFICHVNKLKLQFIIFISASEAA